MVDVNNVAVFIDVKRSLHNYSVVHKWLFLWVVLLVLFAKSTLKECRSTIRATILCANLCRVGGFMGYQVGDMVVYPRHGAARIRSISDRTMRGVTREYLELEVLSSDGLVINVPVDNVKSVGIRDIVDGTEVAEVFAILRAPMIEKEMNWSRRYKLNVEKIATGDVNKIAQVVRDLSQRDVDEHGLSAGEKRMLARARAILTSEIALSEHLDEHEIQRLLDVNLGYQAPQNGDEDHHTFAPEEPASATMARLQEETRRSSKK